MNHELVDEQLLRRLEAATTRLGDEPPELPEPIDAETRQLHEGWQIVGQLFDRAAAEHDSVQIEERVRVGAERKIGQRRWRRRVGYATVAASLLVGLLLGVWFNRQRSATDGIAGIERGALSAGAEDLNSFADDWPSGTQFDESGNPIIVEDDWWVDDCDWQIAMTHDELWGMQQRWHEESFGWLNDSIGGLGDEKEGDPL